MRAVRSLSLLAVMLPTLACGPTVDLSTALQISDVATGWHDAGVVDGKNKLVPTVVFTLTNTSREPLVALQVNAIFRRVGETDELGSGWLSIAKADGLGPGAATSPLTITSKHGYTGTDSRLQLLKNSAFIDARVELFAKYASTQWTRLSEFPVDRRLSDR